MEKSNMSRKERRKAEQKKELSSQVKKSTTALSSALIVSTMATPAILPMIAEATNDNEMSSAEVSQAQETQATEATITSEAPAITESTEVPTTTIPSESTEISETTDIQEAPQDTQKTTENNGEVSPETVVGPSTDDVKLSENEVLTPRAFSAARSMSPAAFIAEIAAYAQPVAAANDLYASVMMAQAIVESGWGGSTLSQAPNYNLFGIKGSYQGQTVYMDTWEYLNGQWVIKKEPFRKYPSYQQSFQDNAYVLRTTSFQAGVYFYSGTWKSNTRSYQDATAWLTGRYATDPSYGTKLNNIISTYNLTQYDTPATNGNTGGNSNNSGNSGNNNTGGNTGGTSTTDVYHTVKAGDSLWALASKYNTTIANIKSWNNLSSDTIYVGQKLIVQKGSGSSAGSTGGNTGNTNTGGSSNSSTSDSYYTVKSGDTLSAIASRHGISLANLRAWNNISGDLIFPGQKLIVKKGNSGSTGGNSSNTNTGNSANNNSTATSYYTVKSGDTLSAIASRHGISLENLRAWNNISGDLIFPGQKLIVKKGSSGSTGGNSSNTNTGNSANNNSSTATSYYTVKSGDTLSAIASRHGISLANLRAWNNISGDLIFPGQKLIVKKGSSGSTGGNSSNTNTGNSANNNSSTATSYYTVKSGDTLSAIALRHGISLANLRAWNNISGDLIFPGQKLVVKKGSGNTGGSSNNSSTTSSNTAAKKTHTVKSGDTLWGLAQQYNTSIQKIKQLNGLSGDIIYIGQVLKVG
jgi:D-gamma-glutamyl-meso-diaminopimelic acid endopeptidase CwlS